MLLRWTTKPFADLTLLELHTLLQLRNEVFVVEQACLYRDIDGCDPQALHLLGHTETGELAAYARLLPAGVSYAQVSFGRVVTAPRYRTHKLGRPLVGEAIRQCQAQLGAGPIKIGALQYLRAFYASFGFVAEGEEYVADGIAHVHLVRP